MRIGVDEVLHIYLALGETEITEILIEQSGLYRDTHWINSSMQKIEYAYWINNSMQKNEYAYEWINTAPYHADSDSVLVSF